MKDFIIQPTNQYQTRINVILINAALNKPDRWLPGCPEIPILEELVEFRIHSGGKYKAEFVDGWTETGYIMKLRYAALVGNDHDDKHTVYGIRDTPEEALKFLTEFTPSNLWVGVQPMYVSNF